MSTPRQTNLRGSGQRFVGRHAELARLDALRAEGHRLVTVFGPPGTGKTRLAEAHVRRVLAEAQAEDWLGGGAWVCELAAQRDLEGVCNVVAAAIGIPAPPGIAGDAWMRRLGDALAARGPILVVLDNAEHVADPVATCVAAWLAAAPDARFLVTSRAQLHLKDEVRFELPALGLPEPGKDVLDAEAVQLFVDRVRAFDGGFAIGEHNASVVAELVSRLEGIPLAIELAASRVDLFGLNGLLEQLHQRLDVLAHPARDVDDRHSTLRAAVDWSWSLLDADERRALAACAVFRGGFSADAARAVLPVDPPATALAAVQALRDESLLRRYEHAPGHARFALFEIVREYAEQRLAAGGEAEEIRRRHATYYLEVGERWAAEALGREATGALDQLALERDNLLAVVAGAFDGAARDSTLASTLARAVLCLDALASVRGPTGSHLELLERTLAVVSPATTSNPAFARLLRARARLLGLHGQSAAARRDLDAALALVGDIDEPRLSAELVVDDAVWLHQRREMDGARARYERALTLARSVGARASEGRALANFGALHHDLRRFDEAAALYRDALTVLQEAGDRRLEAIALANLGLLEQERGDLRGARAHMDAADALLTELGDRRLQAIVSGNRGILEQEEGDLERARACHERALTILREVGDRRSEALCLGRLASAQASAGWIDDAEGCLAAADRLLSRFADPLAAAAVDIDRAFVDLARAREAVRSGDARRRAAMVAAIEQRIARARSGGDAQPWIDQSDDVRTAVRLLERDLEELDTTAEPAVTSRPALLVGVGAAWFQTPDGEPQDLRRRKALRALLWGLVEHHRNAPGAGLGLDALLEIGWPGERVVPSAGANRVYVALTTLRNMGLRGILISRDDGYLLDPALPVERIEREAA